MKSLIQKIKQFHSKITTQIFLACADCEGMCNHCNEILREKCKSVKQIGECG